LSLRPVAQFLDHACDGRFLSVVRDDLLTRLRAYQHAIFDHIFRMGGKPQGRVIMIKIQTVIGKVVEAVSSKGG
jgi:hypothetical protein